MGLVIFGIIVVVVLSFVQALIQLLFEALGRALPKGGCSLTLLWWWIFWPALLPYHLVRWAIRAVRRRRAARASTPGCVVYQFPDRT